MAVVKLTEEQKKLIDNFVKEGKLILKSEKPCTHKGSNATSKIFEFRDKECQKEYSMKMMQLSINKHLENYNSADKILRPTKK